jgi:hypothetical protein
MITNVLDTLRKYDDFPNNDLENSKHSQEVYLSSSFLRSHFEAQGLKGLVVAGIDHGALFAALAKAAERKAPSANFPGNLQETNGTIKESPRNIRDKSKRNQVTHAIYLAESNTFYLVGCIHLS